MKTTTSIFVSHLQRSGVEIINMTPQEEADYRQEWFRTVVPAEKQEQAMALNCFDYDSSHGYKCCGFLWHVFSYDVVDHVEKATARRIFNGLQKKDAVLLINWTGEDGFITSCKLKNIANLKANDFDPLYDIILTDSEFNWAYVKTHEQGFGGDLGPYFWSRNKI